MTPVDCPTPLDWLDMLDGRTEPPAEAHLRECPACRGVVERLRAHEKVAPPSGRDLNLETVVPHRLWNDRPKRITPGEIWLAGPGGELALVLAGPHREAERDWYTVAALDTEVEARTSTEPYLTGGETTIGVPLRLRLDYQAPVAAEVMHRRAGSLTADGERAVDSALNGNLDEERYGPPLTGSTDWRMHVDPDAWRRWWDLRREFDSAVLGVVEEAGEHERAPVTEDQRSPAEAPAAPTRTWIDDLQERWVGATRAAARQLADAFLPRGALIAGAGARQAGRLGAAVTHRRELGAGAVAHVDVAGAIHLEWRRLSRYRGQVVIVAIPAALDPAVEKEGISWTTDPTGLPLGLLRVKVDPERATIEDLVIGRITNPAFDLAAIDSVYLLPQQ